MRLPLRLRTAILFLAVAASAPCAGAQTDALAAWGVAESGLEPHPNVRLGVLPNGMRYALMRNEEPLGGLAVRLRIGAGAAAEGPREEGFLHIVEHMIFHGSETLPEGSLPLFLSQQGLRRWSDFTAFTDYDQTVYRLDLGRADARAVETALRLMREISSRLAFTRRGVAGAKRVIAEEIRGRDAIADRIAAAEAAFLLPGSPAARGPVAGSEGSVRRAGRKSLRRVYDRHYRPEAATLILVGDFDAEAMETQVHAWFADWQAQGPAPAPVSPWNPQPRRTEARLFLDPGARTTVTVSSVRPRGEKTDTGSGRDQSYVEHLAHQMLARRLAPTGGGEAVVYDHQGLARVSQIDVHAADGDWRRALEIAAGALHRALAEGFTQAELDEQLAVSRRVLAAAGAPRTSSDLGDAILDAVNRGLVFTRPADPAAAEAYLASIRLEAVNDAFRAAWSNESRLIMVTHGGRLPGGEAAILDAWRKALSG